MKTAPAPALHSQRGGFVVGLIVGLLIGLGVALGVALYISKVPVPFRDKVGHRSADQDAAEAEKLKGWNPNAGLGGSNAGAPAVPASLPAPATVLPPPAVAVGSGAASAAVRPADGSTQPPSPAVNPAVKPVTPAAKPASAPAAASPAASSAAPPPPKSSRDPLALLSGQSPDAKPAPAAAATDGAWVVQAGAYSNMDDAERQRGRLALEGLTARITEREQNGRTIFRVRLGPFDTREEADRQTERLKSLNVDSTVMRIERSKP